MKISEWIIFENSDFIVINKPSGLLSIPDREGKEISLKNLLQHQYSEIFTVHRLDKETSGVIVFAKNDKAHKYLSQQFSSFLDGEQGKAKEPEKIYLGLVVGSLVNNKGIIDYPIMEHPTKKGFMVVNRNGKQAVTEYELLEDFGIYSWAQFQIHTGRTHQIRVHMKEIGHPVVSDSMYGDGKPVFLSSIKHNFKLSKKEEEERPILNRLGLHSYKLRFTGFDGQMHEFEAPVPKDLRATLQQLSKRKSGRQASL